jgi:hypothetical protein
MCNYATTALTFCSRNVNLLKKLHKKLWNCYALVPHKNLLRDLLNSHNYPAAEQEKLTNKTDYISHCDKVVMDKGSLSFFSCEIICAWHGNLQPFLSLLSHEYHGEIRLSFSSEEPGTEEYLIHDETGVFYPDRFKVDWCYQNNYEIKYFSSFFDVIDYLHAVFPEADLSYYDSLEEVEKQVALAYQEKDENYFLYIHRFSDNGSALDINEEQEAA